MDFLKKIYTKSLKEGGQRTRRFFAFYWQHFLFPTFAMNFKSFNAELTLLQNVGSDTGIVQLNISGGRDNEGGGVLMWREGETHGVTG